MFYSFSLWCVGEGMAAVVSKLSCLDDHALEFECSNFLLMLKGSLHVCRTPKTPSKGYMI